jgi:hypothetical protein
MPPIASSRGAPAAAHSDAPPIAADVAPPGIVLDLTTREKSALTSKGRNANIVQVLPPKELMRNIKAKPRELTHAEEDLLEKDLIAPKAVVGQSVLDSAIVGSSGDKSADEGPYAAQVKAFNVLSKVRPLTIAENEQLGRLRAAYLADIGEQAAVAPAAEAETSRLEYVQELETRRKLGRENLASNVGRIASLHDDAAEITRHAAQLISEQEEKLQSLADLKVVVESKREDMDRIQQLLERRLNPVIRKRALREKSAILADVYPIPADSIDEILDDIRARQAKIEGSIASIQGTTAEASRELREQIEPIGKQATSTLSRLLTQERAAGKAPSTARRELQQYLQGIISPEYAALATQLEPDEEELAGLSARYDGPTWRDALAGDTYKHKSIRSEPALGRKFRRSRRTRETTYTPFVDISLPPSRFLRKRLDPERRESEHSDSDIHRTYRPKRTYELSEEEKEDEDKPKYATRVLSPTSMGLRTAETKRERKPSVQKAISEKRHSGAEEGAPKVSPKSQPKESPIIAEIRDNFGAMDAVKKVAKDVEDGKVEPEVAVATIDALAEHDIKTSISTMAPPAEESAWDVAERERKEAEADEERYPELALKTVGKVQEKELKEGRKESPIEKILLDRAVAFVERQGATNWLQMQLANPSEHTEDYYVGSKGALQLINRIADVYPATLAAFPKPPYLTKGSKAGQRPGQPPPPKAMNRNERVQYVAKLLDHIKKTKLASHSDQG